MELRQFVDELMPVFQEMELSERIAKSYNYNPERNLLDQSMWEHIRSGIEAFLALVHYLESYELDFNEEEMKIAVIAFLLHDLHKDPSIEKTGRGEYGLPLEKIAQVCQSLCEAVEVKIPPAAFLRVAGVSSFSNKLGDLSTLSNQYNWSYIRDWVDLMDQMASITSIAECMEKRTIHNLKHKLAQLLPPKLTEKLQIEFHYLQEMRGMVTTQLHNGMALLMKRYGFFPWVRFGDGTLYISFEANGLPDKGQLNDDLIELFFQSISEAADQVDQEKLFDRSTFQCQTLAFMLYNTPEGFASLFHQIFLKPSSGSKKFPEDKFNSNQLKSYGVETLEELFHMMKTELPQDGEMREKWFYTARYLAALQRLVQRLEGMDQVQALQEVAKFFNLPVADLLDIPTNNRRFDGAIWLAARYLKTTNKKGQPASHLPLEEWRMEVRERATAFLTGRVTPKGCLQIVEDELKIQDDLQRYFSEQLTISWERDRSLNIVDSRELLKKKSRSQKRICNLCNRQIQAGVQPKVKGKVIQDGVNVFSNRLLPKVKDVSALHWCGICSFEFILRQVFAIDSFNDKGSTPRIHLFAFPSFQLTEDVLGELQYDLKNFYGTIQVHRHSKLKHTWQAPYVEGAGGHLREHLRDHFQMYSEYFHMELLERGRPPATGDVLKASPPGNVLLFTFDCYSSSLERTREEAWLKALTAALSLHQLYGFRILMTEKPFLFLSDVREIHYAIHLDAPPYKVARLLGEAAERQTADFVVPIEQTKALLYRLAFLWEIHQTVHSLDFAKPTDKQVSSVLHQLDVHPMAGAYFFKRHLSEHSYPSEAFIRSCQEINRYRGGDKMGLAREIALASLALYKPKIDQKGRAHRYENLFRTVVKGIKEGRDKSELQGQVMKRLERLRDQEAGYVPRIDPERVIQFVDLVYDRFYLEQCGENMAKLNQKENQVADGIFFETHMARLKEIQERKKEKLSAQEEE